MGVISLCTFIAVTVAFVTGRIVAVSDSSDNDNDALAFVVVIFFLIVSVSLPIGATYSYVENKEYSSTKYNLKKKVIITEEDNTVKLTLFTHLQIKSNTMAWYSNSDRWTSLGIPKNDSEVAVTYADALIKVLKGE